MRILFVCTANICRSVMAEAMMRRALLNTRRLFHISSAGVDADPFTKPDRFTVEVCRHNGLEVSSHESRQLTLITLNRVTLILCLGEDHKRVIVGAYPRVARKTFLLKEYGNGIVSGDLTIHDPIGGPKSAYERCFTEIETEIKRITPLLLKKNRKYSGSA